MSAVVRLLLHEAKFGLGVLKNGAVPPMALTELQIKKAKPRDRAYKLADGEGMFLLVKPNGSKLWRMKYRFRRKENLLSFGSYPNVGIASARDLRRQAKNAIVDGTDPRVETQSQP